jgi:hypothetical protein
MLNEMLQENFAFLVIEIKFDTRYIAIEKIKAIMAFKLFLAPLNVLFISEETDKLCHFRSVFFSVVVNKRTQCVCAVYVNLDHLSVVSMFVPNFTVLNFVIYS